MQNRSRGQKTLPETDARASLGEKFIASLGVLLGVGLFANAARNSGLILREPDLWWHIKSGQMMLANAQVPQVDSFSYSHAGQPWIAKEWLAQIIYALGFDAAGWAGPLLIASLAVGLTGWLMFRALAKNLQPFYAAVIVLLAFLLIQGVTVARPHVLTFPIAVGLVALLFDAARAQQRPPFWSLLLVVLWVNLHGSFPLAFAIAGAAFLDYAQRSRLKARATALSWLAYLAACPLVTLLNPYFIKPYLIAADLAHGIGVMSWMSEWAPFSPSANPALEAGFMAVIGGLLLARARLTLGQIIFLLFSFHMMLSHMRFLYVFLLLVPVVVMPEVVAAQPRLSRALWLARPRDGLEQLVGARAALVAGLSLCLGLGYAGFLLRKEQVKPPETTAISGALGFVAQNAATQPALTMKVFNDYNFGGPLILAGIKTYIDGRAEQLFLGDFMVTYLASGDPENSAPLQQILSDQAIGWTLFPPQDPRNKALTTMPGWQKAYEDADAVVFERKP